MLLKLGVDISRLRRPLRRKLNAIDRVYSYYGFEAVITSTYCDNHMPSSLHFCDEALDLRLPPTHTPEIVARLSDKLGPDFDVILESDHIHVEYDPKS